MNKNSDEVISISYPVKTKIQQKDCTNVLPLNTQKLISNQMSMLDNLYAQSQSIHPISLEMNNYKYSLQQKFKKKTKHKLKTYDNINNKQITEKHHEINNKIDNELAQRVKQPKKLCLKHEKTSIVSTSKFNESIHNLDPGVEIIKLPHNNIIFKKYTNSSTSDKLSKFNKKLSNPKGSVIMETGTYNVKNDNEN